MGDEQFQEFKMHMVKILKNTIYNLQSQSISLGNTQIHQEENKREKLHKKTIKKIEEVK